MSENEGGDSRFMTGFLIGFVVGVLICLGVGGTFFVVSVQRRQAMEVERAMHEARAAEEIARREAMQAEAEARARREAAAAAKDRKK